MFDMQYKHEQMPSARWLIVNSSLNDLNLCTEMWAECGQL